MAFSVPRAYLRSLMSRFIEGPLTGLLARSGATPNQLTLAGLALSGGSAYLMATGRFIIAGALLLVAGLFDMLDGALARRRGRVTPFGAFFDSLADRLAEAGSFLGLLVFYVERDDSPAVVLAYLALVASFLVSYARARAEGLGFQGAVGLATRAERVVILSLGLFVGQVPVALGVIAALGFVTFLQRLLHLYRASRGG
ncbi:MAG: CDP-alcohol phosphatidyltransferase family protein [Chloroflexi bacterium]|nr:CDP-alcohol phosphatidyltransferase family protein [Chloroflexota bacterium]